MIDLKSTIINRVPLAGPADVYNQYPVHNTAKAQACTADWCSLRSGGKRTMEDGQT